MAKSQKQQIREAFQRPVGVWAKTSREMVRKGYAATGLGMTSEKERILHGLNPISKRPKSIQELNIINRKKK